MRTEPKSKGHLGWIMYDGVPTEVFEDHGDAYLAPFFIAIEPGREHRAGEYWCSSRQAKVCMVTFQTA